MDDLRSEFASSNVLITGGMGFIGSNLAHRLVELGAHVTVVDSCIEGQGANPFNLEDIKDRIKILLYDLRDRGPISEAVKGKDYIFNLAAFTSHVRSYENPLEDLEVNCRSHLVFLETVRKHNPGARIIYTGSRCQYGKALYLPIDEAHPFNVVDINGAHKATVECYHRLHEQHFGIQCVCVRLANVFGPRHQMNHSKQGFLNWFIRVALLGEEIQVFGDGSQLRDFLYVDDAVEAILLLAAREESYGDVFNLGSGKPLSVLESAQKVAELTGCSYRLTPFPSEYLAIEVGDLYLDISKACSAISWEPSVTFEEGLKRTIDFYRRYGDHYWGKNMPESVTHSVQDD
jgi:UDP-glucose 4-epimerase